MKRWNLRIIWIEEKEDSRLQGPENNFKKIIEQNFPNLKKEMHLNIQDAYRTPTRLDLRINSFLPIKIKTLNLQKKEKILKVSRKNGSVTYKRKSSVTYKGSPIRITHDVSVKTRKARHVWADTTRPQMQAQPTRPSKTFKHHRGGEENKIFQEKNKFKQYLCTIPALQKWQEGKLDPIWWATHKKIQGMSISCYFIIANPKEDNHTNNTIKELSIIAQ